MGGSAAWDGAMRLQCSQLARVMWMSLVIPGQKMDVSARAIMDDTPWWAAWRAVRQCGLMDGGITILSLYSTTPLTQ